MPSLFQPYGDVLSYYFITVLYQRGNIADWICSDHVIDNISRVVTLGLQVLPMNYKQTISCLHWQQDSHLSMRLPQQGSQTTPALLCIDFLLPYFLNHRSLIRLPLLTMLTLGSFSSSLQNWTSWPTNSPLSWRNGSPPEKLIFSIPRKGPKKVAVSLTACWVLPSNTVPDIKRDPEHDSYRDNFLDTTWSWLRWLCIPPQLSQLSPQGSPASLSISSPRLASSRGSTKEVLAVWKQKPHL